MRGTGQAKPVTLGSVPDRDAGPYISGCFHAAGRDVDPILPNLLREAGGHAQRLMLLAHALFDRLPTRGVAPPVDWQKPRASVMEMLGDGFRGQRSGSPKSRQRVLRAIAVSGSPLSRGAHVALGVTTGSVGGAVRAPRDRGEIEQTSCGTVDSPVARWLREGCGATAADVLP